MFYVLNFYNDRKKCKGKEREKMTEEKVNIQKLYNVMKIAGVRDWEVRALRI